MNKEIICSIIVPVFNEESTIKTCLEKLSTQLEINSCVQLDPNLFEIIVVDNNSTDNTINIVKDFKIQNPQINIIILPETRQGVAWARKSGMDFAISRSQKRDNTWHITRPFYLLSTDADCYVDFYWLSEQIFALQRSQAALSVCNYYYPMEHFKKRPNLANIINEILKMRDKAMRIFGGFPDGKGFAVLRDKYEKIGGIEIFYQLSQGKFTCHLSDDWDFGIKMRASGENIIYCPNARVHTNPRRVDYALTEMVQGVAYGQNGIITMRDIREKTQCAEEDLSLSEAQLLYDYSIKDFTIKHIILPILLTPEFLETKEVIDFFTPTLSQQLARRIFEIVYEMRVKDFTPIHLYKTPCFRLYFEFRHKLFERMKCCLYEKIANPPPLPECLESALQNEPSSYLAYVYYYCEDRESGAAHNYFGNGGVF